MQQKTYNVYKFDELTDEQKQKAVDNLRNINVDYDWWDFTYEDAKQAGLEITGFDLDRNRHATGKFINGALDSAHAIEKEHGKEAETYKTAQSYLKDRGALVTKYANKNNPDTVDEEKTDDFDSECDELDDEFLKSLLEDYSIMLQKESEYKTTDEAIIETIQANDYDFTEDGKID
jgi:hypothetical protein